MIIEMIQEWFKELLIDGIISNLSGTFDTVNTKVGEIAGEVGMTPAGWNGGIGAAPAEVRQTPDLLRSRSVMSHTCSRSATILLTEDCA